MNWRHALTLSAIAALALVAMPGSAVPQQKSLKEQLVGTWLLVSWDQERPDGTKFQRFGANPNGVHIFDANGRYAVILAHPDLPRIASNNPSTPTPEELKGLTGRSIAYYGTYTVDEAAKVIDLKVEASSFPNQVGANNKRTITLLTANELKYQNTTALTGGQIYIAFKRAPAAATN
jgi:Lipocalin-like domain